MVKKSTYLRNWIKTVWQQSGGTLAPSFRYYDPILALIQDFFLIFLDFQDNLDNDIRDYYLLKNSLAQSG